MNEREIYLDLDGTTVDCVRAALRLHGRPDLAADPSYPPSYDWEVGLGISHAAFWNKVDEAGAAWWEGLDPTPFGLELIAVAASFGHPLHVATKTLGDAAACGKWRWIKRHFPKGTEIHITSNKTKLAGVGRLLIDDSPYQVDEWREADGDAILVPATYNDNRHYVGSELEFIKAEIWRLGYGRT
jgi:hypothetical protein